MLWHSEDPLEELFGLPTVERAMHSAAPAALIVPVKNTNPLFDFADARNRVYQCTLSLKKHSYDAEYLLRVLFVVNYETLTASGVPEATKKKCEDCRQNIAFKRRQPITGEITFSEVTRDIYGLLAAASRGSPLMSLHFVWVVADPRPPPQGKSQGSATSRATSYVPQAFVQTVKMERTDEGSDDSANSN